MTAAGRRIKEKAHTFETGSLWDVRRAIAVDGPLRGAVVRALPYSTAFDWAWLDFYPESSVWAGG